MVAACDKAGGDGLPVVGRTDGGESSGGGGETEKHTQVGGSEQSRRGGERNTRLRK